VVGCCEKFRRLLILVDPGKQLSTGFDDGDVPRVKFAHDGDGVEVSGPSLGVVT
jgi:hypothetical protein